MTIALVIWIGCLVGASLFYVAGLWLADPLVLPALEWLGLQGDFEDQAADLDSGSLFWTVFLVSFLPAPMQLATLGAGTVAGSFPVFLGAIAASRGLRYFGLAVLANLFGPKIAEFGIPKNQIVVVFAVLTVGWLALPFSG